MSKTLNIPNDIAHMSDDQLQHQLKVVRRVLNNWNCNHREVHGIVIAYRSELITALGWRGLKVDEEEIGTKPNGTFQGGVNNTIDRAG